MFLSGSLHSFARTLKSQVPTKFRSLGDPPKMVNLAPNVREALGKANEKFEEVIQHSTDAIELGPKDGRKSLIAAQRALGRLKVIRQDTINPDYRGDLKTVIHHAKKEVDYAFLLQKKEDDFDEFAKKAAKPGSVVSGGSYAGLKALLPGRVSESALQGKLNRLIRELPKNDANSLAGGIGPQARNEERANKIADAVDNSDKVVKARTIIQHVRKTGTISQPFEESLGASMDHLYRNADDKETVPKLDMEYSTMKYENKVRIRREARERDIEREFPSDSQFSLKDSSSLGESRVEYEPAQEHIQKLKEQLQALETDIRTVASRGLAREKTELGIEDLTINDLTENMKKLLNDAKAHILPTNAADRLAYRNEKQDIIGLAKNQMEAIEKINKSEAFLQKIMDGSAMKAHLRTQNPSYASNVLHKALKKTGLTSSFSETEIRKKIDTLEKRYAAILKPQVEGDEHERGVMPNHLDEHHRPALEILTKLRDTKSEIKTSLKRVASSGLGSVKNINGVPYQDKRKNLDTLFEEYKERSFMPIERKATPSKDLDKYAVDAKKSLIHGIKNSMDMVKPWHGQGMLTAENFDDKEHLSTLPSSLQLLRSRITHLHTLDAGKAATWKAKALEKLNGQGGSSEME